MQGKHLLIVGGLAVVVAAGVVVFVGGGLGGPSTSVLELDNPSEEQIAEIAELLLVEDGEIKKRADQKLFDLGTRSVPALKRFAPKGFAQADKALSLINDIEPDAVFEVAEQLLENESLAVRTRAVSFLQIRKQDRQAIEVWVKALGNSEAEVRSEACHLLGNVPRAHRSLAVEGLQTLRTDPDAHVRENAAQALKVLTGRDYKAQFNVE